MRGPITKINIVGDSPSDNKTFGGIEFCVGGPSAGSKIPGPGAQAESKVAQVDPTHPKPTPFDRKLNSLSIDIGDDVMMTHYDSMVKRILDKNWESDDVIRYWYLTLEVS